MKALVVGSAVIDIFLSIENEKDVEQQNDKVFFTLGDKIPTKINRLAIGGNGANVSVGLTRLGLESTFYTYLGNDIFSREIEENITKEGVSLRVERGNSRTSSLSLVFDFKGERIIFSHHETRDHGFSFDETLPDFAYITSIGKEWKNAYSKVLTYLTSHSIPYAFAPGSQQLLDQNEEFQTMLSASTLLFINKDEASRIIETMKNIKTDDIRALLTQLKHLGPQIISITDGANGAYCMDGQADILKISSYPGKGEIVEKTGAGDAYASGFLTAYLLNNDLSECMRWGVTNAWHSMKQIGGQAGLLRKREILAILDQNKDHRAQKI